MSWADAGGPARGWAGPGRTVGPDPSIFDMMGRGRVRPINFSEDGSRPSPAHHIFKNSRPGPAHHMAARPMKHGLYMGRPDNYEGRPVDLGRPMCCPVLKGACGYADVIV